MVPPTTVSLFSQAWDNFTIPKSAFFSGHVTSNLTCSIFVDREFIVHGYDDGLVIVSSVFTVCSDFLKTDVQSIALAPITKADEFKPPQHMILRGHTGKITCLLSPTFKTPSGIRDWIVSGSSDFTVRLWVKSTGKLVHTFCHQTGEVSDNIAYSNKLTQ